MTATTLSKGPYPPIVLTGPTGWIGNAFVNYAHSRFGADAISSARFYASQARAHVFPGGLKADLKGLEDLKPADIEGAVVIHLA
jgi:nucleoside-diphosphate-sugar epimerase